MNLRTKTFLIVCLVFISAFLVLAILLSNFIRNGYVQEEDRSTLDKVEQLQSVIDDSLTDLNSEATFLANWDDTYKFMQDKNTVYIDYNLTDSIFFNNRWNLGIFINNSGEIVYGKAYDFTEGKSVPVPESITAYFKRGSTLLAQPDSSPGVKGIISFPESPMLVAAHPILTGQGSGPSRGTLVIGRYLDSLEIGRISRITGLSIQIYQTTASSIPPDFQSALPQLSQGIPAVTQPLNDNSIAGYSLQKDVTGNPAIILRVDAPRTLYAQAEQNILYFNLALMAFGLVFILTTLLLLERMVISRIARLSTNVNAIGKSGDLDSRVSISGKDEVSSLAADINHMLENLAQSKKLQQESETFNYALIQDSPNPIEVINPDYSIRYVNPAMEKITGYAAAELLGQRVPYPWWLPGSYDENTIELKKAMTTGTQKQERHFRRQNGESFWVELTSTPVKEGNGELAYFIVNWVDITARKQAEETLRESEKFRSSLSDSSPYPVMVINPDKSIRYVNPALERITGFSAAELVARNIPYPWWPKDRTGEYASQFKETIDDPHEMEIVLHKKTGESFWVNINHTQVKDGDTIKYYLSIWMDITMQKLSREELEKSYQREKNLREQLQAEIKSRAEFTRALVHELKTPLTPILASSELLVEEISEEPLLGLAKNVHRGAENMNRRVDELLDLARGDVGILKVNLRPIDPLKMLQEVFKYMEPMVRNTGQTLSMEISNNLSVIMADDDRLRQVLFNLISNAIKYSQPGDKIDLRARQDEKYLTIEVQDTGRGMSQDEQEKLFQPYYRIEGRERMSGLGLGLALSKKLVELHDGRIWVRSQKGRGSTFYFAIPLQAKDQMVDSAKTGGK